MKPASENLELYRGDTFRRRIRLREINPDGTPGAYLDLTGTTPLAQVRTADRAPEILVTITVDLLDQSDPDTKGGLTISLEPAETAELPDVCKWDLQLTWPSGDVTTYVAGKVIPSGQVTF